MSACPDNNSGYLDGEDEVSDQEPHELTTDHGVTEVQEAVPQEENSIDGTPKKTQECLGNREGRENFAPSDREEGLEVSLLQWDVV